MSEKGVLIIGGGITGITTAVELAEAGKDVTIIEKNPYLGGRVAQLNKYFPKLCPPVCGLEMNFRRIKENAKVKIFTQAEVSSVSGSEGNLTATIKINPRYVNDRCTSCGECAKVCPSERPNDFNFGMDTTKAAYLPFNQAFPDAYVIDRGACKEGCTACKDACKYEAIELDMAPKTVELTVASVTGATGWIPYDVEKLDTLGAGKMKNVISNMQMERMASPSGPTGGKILRPSDGEEAKSVAFVQCAGSRDENHLPYCSYVCCMVSLKQVTYLREQSEETEAEIFYIDMRTPGRYEKFLTDVMADEKVTLTKGKVARITELEGGQLEVEAEDVIAGKKIKKRFDMVVLATGMQPSGADQKIAGLKYNPDGFTATGEGIVAAGVAKNPLDVARCVQSACSAAIKGIQALRAGR